MIGILQGTLEENREILLRNKPQFAFLSLPEYIIL